MSRITDALEHALRVAREQLPRLGQVVRHCGDCLGPLDASGACPWCAVRAACTPQPVDPGPPLRYHPHACPCESCRTSRDLNALPAPRLHPAIVEVQHCVHCGGRWEQAWETCPTCTARGMSLDTRPDFRSAPQCTRCGEWLDQDGNCREATCSAFGLAGRTATEILERTLSRLAPMPLWLTSSGTATAEPGESLVVPSQPDGPPPAPAHVTPRTWSPTADQSHMFNTILAPAVARNMFDVTMHGDDADAYVQGVRRYLPTRIHGTVSAAQFEELAAAASRAGVSAEELSRSLVTLQRGLAVPASAPGRVQEPAVVPGDRAIAVLAEEE